MADNSAIEWTEATWNPVTGCSKVSPGCAHCYAETFAERWRGTAGHPYEQGFDLRLWPHRLEQPLRWTRPRMIFVNSMSDLFHEDIPASFIADVFDVMVRAEQHTFQVLTKRQERLVALAPELPWPDNVWMGVTIENRRFVHRADYLRCVPAAVRFISAEPLLGPLEGLDLTDIDWLISGGESGPKHRPGSGPVATVGVMIAREERGELVDAVLLCLGRDDGRTYVSVASRWVTDDTESCVADGFRVELFAAPDGDRVRWWTEVSIGSISTGEVQEHETDELTEALAYASARLATLRGRGADLGADFTVEEIDEGVRTGTWG